MMNRGFFFFCVKTFHACFLIWLLGFGKAIGRQGAVFCTVNKTISNRKKESLHYLVCLLEIVGTHMVDHSERGSS